HVLLRESAPRSPGAGALRPGSSPTGHSPATRARRRRRRGDAQSKTGTREADAIYPARLAPVNIGFPPRATGGTLRKGRDACCVLWTAAVSAALDSRAREPAGVAGGFAGLLPIRSKAAETARTPGSACRRIFLVLFSPESGARIADGSERPSLPLRT